MVIIDAALVKREKEGRPIRVGMFGAGFMGRGITHQICRYTPGIELSVICNRDVDKALAAYRQAGVSNVKAVYDVHELDSRIKQGQYAVTSDPRLICESELVEAVIEVTGSIEYGTEVVLNSIRRRKHVILMNAELDGTIGPILKVIADRHGVIYSNTDGDQPGVEMNLFRFVRSIGCKPVLAGNIKGFHDPYRNPTTQESFARQWGQNARMVTSFADGTKISFEQAVVANATGMGIARRGMTGPQVPPGTPIESTLSLFPLSVLGSGAGIVDYIVGAAPSPGVFVIGHCDDPVQQKYLDLYKLGKGPFYYFYRPYHLCHFEVAFSVARAVLFQDPTIAPKGFPRVGVITAAKEDLKAGVTLDGCGGYLTYGLAENYKTITGQRLLPMGLAEGCILRRSIAKDEVVTFADVEIPEGRFCDRLYTEQLEYFGSDGI